jgi:hypothetical protein
MNITSVDGNWVKGTHSTAGNTFAFSAKVFPERNPALGITEGDAEGHVSKLDVTNERLEKIAVCYDRGWGKNNVPGITQDIVEYLERDGVLAKVEQNL